MSHHASLSPRLPQYTRGIQGCVPISAKIDAFVWYLVSSLSLLTNKRGATVLVGALLVSRPW